MNISVRLAQPTRFRSFFNPGPAVVLVLATLCVALCLFAQIASAADTRQKGVLDEPAGMPTTGPVAPQQPSVSELKEEMKEHKKALKAEHKKLKKMRRSELMKLARKGERAAQLVLAEDFADEAISESITIISANDAMSDAAYWYSLAARRGYPGAPAVDGTLPLFPLRGVRGRN